MEPENPMLPPLQEWTIQPDGSIQVLPPPGEGKCYIIHDDLTYSVVDAE